MGDPSGISLELTAKILNDKKIRVTDRKDLAGAMIITGTPPRDRARVGIHLDYCKDLLSSAEDIRRTGSAALDLAYVACGRADAYFESGIKAWDVAAGMLLVREAGGRVSDFKGRGANAEVLILDARSAEAFAAGHIKGAVNLPLPDFNEASLKEVLGKDQGREVLIYCNNNFTNDVWPIPVKVVRLALNIQTFINLYGYGYKNVYELGEAVDRNLPAVEWVGNPSDRLTVLR